MSINIVVISGNLTRDPEARSTPSGTGVLEFGVAVNDRRKNPHTGQWEDVPNFIDCAVFGARADALGRLLHKGSKVSVRGHLKWSQWEAKDGSKRSKISVVADDVELMSRGAAEPQTAQDVVMQAYPTAVVTDAYADEDIPF